ncbi:MAG: L,D-transpeptidase catalytic domain [Verrucomicrobiaceae bacterium]|nr:L,D-transpeptidase catalytic domain [Verrucomicrobiaceae bacterium]
MRQFLLLSLIASLSAAAAAQPRERDDGVRALGNHVPADKDTILRVQIYLDQELFTPGKIDGDLGEFSYKAVVNWNYARGKKDIYDWEAIIRNARSNVPVAVATYTIREDLFKYVNPKLPEQPEHWQEFKQMSYRSMLELVAERFHTDETFLQKLNPGVKLDRLQPDDEIQVPNVRPFKIELVKQYQNFKTDPALAGHTVVIDTVERMGAVYDEDEHMLAAFPITPGKPQFIPRGQWKIVVMQTTPDFRYDKKFLEEGQRGSDDTALKVPPGPNSPVGILWAGLSKSGIGLHGTASPRTIGRAQSAGCVRFANWDAIRLPSLVRPGSQVIVR